MASTTRSPPLPAHATNWDLSPCPVVSQCVVDGGALRYIMLVRCHHIYDKNIKHAWYTEAIRDIWWQVQLWQAGHVERWQLDQCHVCQVVVGAEHVSGRVYCHVVHVWRGRGDNDNISGNQQTSRNITLNYLLILRSFHTSTFGKNNLSFHLFCNSI